MTGGIEKRARKHGDVYRAVVYLGDGRRVSRTFPTLREARRWKTATERDAHEGRLARPATTRLADALDELLARVEAGSVRTRTGTEFKPSVVRTYRSHVAALKAWAGGARIDQVSRRDLQRLVEELRSGGADPSTIRNRLMPLRLLYRHLLRDGVVATSPLDHLDLPSIVGRRDRVATPDEAAALIAAIPNHVRDRALWATAFYAGLRMGELRALPARLVDLEFGVIRVRSTLDQEGARVEPKSRAGVRDVPIVAALRPFLVDVPCRDEPAFPSARGGAFDPNRVNDRARRGWAAAGLAPIGLHEARHTFASLAIAAGVNAKTLSTYMGHSSVAITLDRYGHLFPGSEDEFVARMDAYLGVSRLGITAGSTPIPTPKEA